MFDIEYRIMKMIHKTPNCSWIDVLNAFDPESQCRATEAILECLLDHKQIEVLNPREPKLSTVSLPSESICALLVEEEKRNKEAEQERKRRKERIADRLFSAGIALVSAAVGALLPVLVDLLDHLAGLAS